MTKANYKSKSAPSDEEYYASRLDRAQRYKSAWLASLNDDTDIELATHIASLAGEAASHNGTTDQRKSEARPSLIVDTKRDIPSPPYILRALQEWDGRVESIGNESFIGVLIDRTNGDKTESERAEFSLDDVSAADHAMLREGAIFRWVIGYQRLEGGMQQRVSQIVFRRLPAWREDQLQEAKSKGRGLIDRLRAATTT